MHSQQTIKISVLPVHKTGLFHYETYYHGSTSLVGLGILYEVL